MTLYRRRLQYGMLAERPSATLNDTQLQDTLRQMRREYPEFGNLSIKDTRTYLRFVTGSSVLPSSPLTTMFNNCPHLQ